MRRWLAAVPVLVLLVVPAARAERAPDAAGAPVTDFKAQPLYRAVSLSWTVTAPGERLTFQIARADTFADGPYTEVTTIESTAGQTSYRYVDRRVGTEARYFYTLRIKETGHTVGPISARPYFSPPAT